MTVELSIFIKALFQTESCCDKLYITWDVCAYGFWGYYTYYRGSPSTPVIQTFTCIYQDLEKEKNANIDVADNIGGPSRKARGEFEICVGLRSSIHGLETHLDGDTRLKI